MLTFNVGVFCEQGKRTVKYYAYTNSYRIDWEGSCKHKHIAAKDVKEAKRIAIRDHKRLCLKKEQST